MTDDESRTAAWAEVHDPATNAARLAEIAARHPEFAEAIAAHPNCYDGLRGWLAANAPTQPFVDRPASVPESAPDAAEPSRHTRRRWIIGGSIAAVVLVAAVGAAAAVISQQHRQTDGTEQAAPGGHGAVTPSSAATRMLAGPPIYVGDELDWFIPSDEQMRAVVPDLPDAAGITAASSGIGETEGAHAVPDRCTPLLFSDDSMITGVRTQQWGTAEDFAAASNVSQFPTAALADAYYHETVDAIAGCAKFDVVAGDGTVAGQSNFSFLTGSADDDLVVIEQKESGDYGFDMTRALAVEGNIVITYSVETGGDPQTLSAMAGEIVKAAHDRLVEEIGFR